MPPLCDSFRFAPSGCGFLFFIAASKICQGAKIILSSSPVFLCASRWWLQKTKARGAAPGLCSLAALDQPQHEPSKRSEGNNSVKSKGRQSTQNPKSEFRNAPLLDNWKPLPRGLLRIAWRTPRGPRGQKDKSARICSNVNSIRQNRIASLVLGPRHIVNVKWRAIALYL